jgi:hypothetical protein
VLIRELVANHYAIPLPVALSDSTHGTIKSFELVTARVRDAEGAEGTGYTYTVGAGGAAVHALVARDLAPLLVGRDADLIESHWQAMWWALHYGGRGGAQALAMSAVDIRSGIFRPAGGTRRSGECSAASIRACRATPAASTSISRSTRSCARPTKTWPAAFARSR